MKQKTLSVWLKIIIVIVALCTVAVYGFVVPMYGQAIVGSNPEKAYCYLPWLIFIESTAVPLAAAFLLAWMIAVNIGRDRSFSPQNAKLFKTISFLALFDAVFFFVGNVILLFKNMSHPGVALLSTIPVLVGLSVSVAAAALSHLVEKAAVLQDQSDWTI